MTTKRNVICGICLFLVLALVLPPVFGGVKKVSKAKNYNCANLNIATGEYCPPIKDGTFTLYHFGEEVESDDAIEAMENDGKHPATLGDLLAFDKANPELKAQFPLIALGSILVGPDGDRYVPYIWDYDSESSQRVKVELALWDGEWFDFCRFLAVSKTP